MIQQPAERGLLIFCVETPLWRQIYSVQLYKKRTGFSLKVLFLNPMKETFDKSIDKSFFKC